MTKPNALILTGYGINCDYETEAAFNQAGANAKRVHINDLIGKLVALDDFQILAFPGGFSFGDDIASGRVLANKFVTNLREPLARFVEADKLVIGICNGFQVMVKCALITAEAKPLGPQTVTLTNNDSNRYEDRWVHLSTEGERCVFTRGLTRLELPVAHGEGKFFAPEETLDRLEAQGRVVLRYATDSGGRALGRFPANPNGSPRDIAGVCDASGRVFGLMPHPERYLAAVNHPRFTALADHLRRAGKEPGDVGEGFRIFRNAVEYFG